MRIILAPNPDIRHLFGRPDSTDGRLAYTKCGIRFAWGEPTKYPGLKKNCKACYV